MAKKSKSDNYDVIGGIFDFIFSESKKPVDKRRPIKASGVSGTGAFADAISSALETPGVIMSDSVLNELNKALDLKLASFNFDENGEVKITTKDLASFLRDPSGYIDKQIKSNQADRKAMRATFIGEAVQDFVATSWAYKYGNEEAKKAVLANTTANGASEKYKVARALGQFSARGITDTKYAPKLDYMSERSLDLLGKKTFGNVWDSMDDNDKLEFSQILSDQDGGLIDDSLRYKQTKDILRRNGIMIGDSETPTQQHIQRYLAKKYGVTYAKGFESAAGSDPNSRLNIFDPNLYRKLEKQNLAERIGKLKKAAPGSAEEAERKTYEKTLLILNAHNATERAEIYKDITDLRKTLASTTDANERKKIKEEIKNRKDALFFYNRETLFGKIGQAEGYINSINELREGQLIPSIINGKFFSPNNTAHNPVEQRTLGTVKINVAKKGNNKITNSYNQFGENLYYMTPASIAKTFFYNGEGFGRALSMYLDRMEAEFHGIKEFEELKAHILGIMEKDGSLDIESFVKDSMGKINIQNLKLGVKQKLTKEQLDKLEKILTQSAKLKNSLERFSRPFRAIEKLKKRFSTFVNSKLAVFRAKFGRMLLRNPVFKNLLIKTGASKLLGTWIASGGIKILVKSLVTALAGAVGLVGTPIASFLVTIGTWVATELLMKLLKVGVDLGKLLTMGVVGLFVFFFAISSKSVGNFNDNNFAYSNATPGSVVDCGAYDNDPIEGGTFIPVDYDQMCTNGESIQDIYDRVASSMGIGTQLELVTCPGHYMCDSISWAWCYSASSIFCRADKLATVLSNCSILERLFIHELVHQVQGRNAGGVYGTLLREWGADYVSANGGGYSFLTDEGCIRATQTSISVCDEETLTAIAYSEGWAYETECRRALSSYINDFCAR